MTSVQDVNTIEREIAKFELMIDDLRAKVGKLSEDRVRCAEDSRNSRLDYANKSKEDQYNSLIVAHKSRLEELEEQQRDIENQFFQASLKVDLDSYREQYREKNGDTFSLIEEMDDDIRNRITGFMGDRLEAAINRNLDGFRAKKKIRTFSLFINKYQTLSKDVKHLPRYSTRWVEKISNLFESWNFGNDFESDKKEGSKLSEKSKLIIILSVVCVLLVGAMLYFIFPVMVLICLVLMGYNVYSFSKMYAVILNMKILRESMEDINKSLDKALQDNIDEDREIIQEERAYRLESSQEEIETVKKEMSDIAANLDKTFQADFSVLDAQLEHALASIDTSIATANKDIAELSERINVLSEDKKRAQEELRSYLDTLTGRYLDHTRIGTEKLFHGKFLVDTRKDKPIIWEHPKKSCLFIYDKTEDLEKFLRLIFLQLRNTLSPHSCSITVMDIQTMATVALPFTSLDNDLCTTVTSSAAISDSLASLEESLQVKTVLVRKEFSTIDEYNEYMMSIDSIPEAYKFVFTVNMDKLYSNDVYKQLLINGAGVGMYVHSFVRQDLFVEMGEQASDFMDLHEQVYVFNTIPRSRAKEIVRANILGLE